MELLSQPLTHCNRSIDPRDNDQLEQRTQFIKDFNNSFIQFSTSAALISKQIKHYFNVDPEEEELEHEVSELDKLSRVIKELDKNKAYSLDENFTYKRPYGFVLENSAYKGIKTWKSLFIQILKELYKKDKNIYLNLPNEKKFISKRNNPLFSKNPNELRSFEKIPGGFFVEVNLSANHIKNALIDLLEHFSIDYKNLKIYLREDRNA
jgi:hypothetical protein